jgi:hypothetical protein
MLSLFRKITTKYIYVNKVYKSYYAIVGYIENIHEIVKQIIHAKFYTGASMNQSRLGSLYNTF